MTLNLHHFLTAIRDQAGLCMDVTTAKDWTVVAAAAVAVLLAHGFADFDRRLVPFIGAALVGLVGVPFLIARRPAPSPPAVVLRRPERTATPARKDGRKEMPAKPKVKAEPPAPPVQAVAAVTAKPVKKKTTAFIERGFRPQADPIPRAGRRPNAMCPTCGKPMIVSHTLAEHFENVRCGRCKEIASARRARALGRASLERDAQAGRRQG